MCELTLEAAGGPAFHQFTPAVERGLRYVLQSLAIDIAHTPSYSVRDSETGNMVQAGIGLPIDSADLTAAADWLRYQIAKRGT